MGRVRFFAQLSQVSDKVRQGYALSVIYRQYQTVLRISYSQFCRYVSKHVQLAKPRAPANALLSAAPAFAPAIPAPRPALAPRRFEYDPAQALEERDKLI